MPIDSELPDPPPLVGEAVVAGAVAAHAADPHHPGLPPHTHCQNCGTGLRGPFCHHCGQHDFDVHRSFGHMFLDALENFFHFDAKFFRNIVTLLFQPGRLSAEFNAGKRASQMPPFRLYLFISVLFFFISFLGTGSGGGEEPLYKTTASEQAEALRDLASETTDPAAQQRLQAVAARLENPAAPHPELSGEELRDVPATLAGQIKRELAAEKTRSRKTLRPGGPGLNVQVEEKRDTELERYLTDKGKYALEHQRELQEAFLHALPRMLLFCLPFMALYARVLFRRTGYVYLQHFIVALHYHTFVYLWWLVSQGWGELIGIRLPGVAGLVGFCTGLWMFLYPFFMFRRLFGQSWKRTIFKTIALALAYAGTLGVGFVLTAIIVFMSV